MSVSLDFKSTHPLLDQELHFRAISGTITAIYGASGRGKSTVLSQIWGSKPISFNGHIYIRDNDQSIDLSNLKPAHLAFLRRRYMSYLAQDPTVLKRDFLSTWFPLDDPRFQDGIRAFDLAENLLQRRAGEVSGGELQRFVLLRAILNPTPILLLDEPFTGLDSVRIQRVSAFIRTEAKRGRLIAITTHESLDYADQTLHLA